MARGGLSRRRLLPGDGPLARVPPIVAFLVVAAVFAAGVLLGGAIGAALLLLLAAGLGALLAATWRTLDPGSRGLRLVVLLILVAIAISLVS